jgi:hypothetical protein
MHLEKKKCAPPVIDNSSRDKPSPSGNRNQRAMKRKQFALSGEKPMDEKGTAGDFPS